MIYADYEFYTATYGGNQIKEADWTRTAREASAYIDQLTFGRLTGHPERVTEEVQMAVCAAAEVVGRYKAEATGIRPGVKSASNDGYSETYADTTEMQKSRKTDLWEAADLYLPLSHPLRYAGVCSCW